MLSFKSILVLTASFIAFQSSSAEACMPSRDSVGTVRCPRVVTADSEITHIESLHQEHSGMREVIGESMTINFTHNEITLPVDAICPKGAYCILPVFTKTFRIDRQVLDRDGSRTYYGTEINPAPGSVATIQVTDYMGAVVHHIPAMTIIRYSTRAVAPRARKKTSVFYGAPLAYRPVIQLLAE